MFEIFKNIYEIKVNLQLPIRKHTKFLIFNQFNKIHKNLNCQNISHKPQAHNSQNVQFLSHRTWFFLKILHFHQKKNVEKSDGKKKTKKQIFACGFE